MRFVFRDPAPYLLALALVAPPALAAPPRRPTALPKTLGGKLLRVKQTLRLTRLRTQAAVANFGGRMIGEAELVGLRYPVKDYEAKVSSGLWRGSRLPAGGYADLKQRGFKSIIGLTEEKDLDRQGAKAFGLTHDFIPILDNTAPSRAQVDKFLSIVQQKNNLPAYVHCEAGIGRTGVMVAVYRMAVEGWPSGKAIVEARKYGLKLRSQIDFLRQFGVDLRAGIYTKEAVTTRLTAPEAAPKPFGVRIKQAGASLKEGGYWAKQALEPVPAAIAEGIEKRVAGATALHELAQADLQAMPPEELAVRARTLLYANPLQRVTKGKLLHQTFDRVLGAYDGDPVNGPAKTEQLLSHMILSNQNAGHAARRLGKDAVAAIQKKLASLRIDSTRPVADRVAELKKRVEMGDGPAKRGRVTFFQTGEEIEQAMLGEIGKAEAAAARGEPAYFMFSTYALEDRGPGHEVGQRLAAALKSAADAGVHVVGLYDNFGSKLSGVENARTDRGYFKEMNDYASPDGGKRIALVPIKQSPLVSHGSHQKWALAVTGGKDGGSKLSAMMLDANLASLYMGKKAPWQDTAARVEGPPTEDVAKMARERLVANGYQPDEAMLKALSSKQAEVTGADVVEMSVMNHVAGRDLKNKNFVLDTISSLGKGDSLKWSEPYADDRDITAALLAARGRGADVNLVFDRNNDIGTAAGAERATYQKFLDAGAKVFEYGKTLPTQATRAIEPVQVKSPATTKVFSHAKVMLVRYADGRKILAMGSANGDNRSEGDTVAGGVLTGNDESLAVFYGGKIADQVERDFMKPQLTRWSSPIIHGEFDPTLKERVENWALRRFRGFD